MYTGAPFTRMHAHNIYMTNTMHVIIDATLNIMQSCVNTY